MCFVIIHLFRVLFSIAQKNKETIDLTGNGKEIINLTGPPPKQTTQQPKKKRVWGLAVRYWRDEKGRLHRKSERVRGRVCDIIDS